MEEKRKQLLDSVKSEAPNDFIQCTSKLKTQLKDLLQTISLQQLGRFFAKVQQLVENSSSIDVFLIEENENLPTSADKDTLKLLTAAVRVVNAFIEDSERRSPACDELAYSLHNLIFRLYNSKLPTFDNVANQIVALCELYWEQQRPKHELLVPQALSYLLLSAMSESARGVDIQRLVKYREAVSVIDLSYQSSESLKSLLVRSAIHPAMIRSKDGRKFITYLFGVSSDLVTTLHSSIKVQLPHCRKAILEAYGEVYYKAWKNSTDEITATIEQKCIQDIITTCVHAAHSTLHTALRRVLDYFNNQKRAKGVDAMLLRLYEPILFRSMDAANCEVRVNAATLFVNAFPLQDTEAPAEEVEQILQKQFDYLEKLLEDSAPAVRVVGVQGVCRVLGVYWELIPAPVCRSLLTRLTTQLAFDASSISVRVAVFRGLQYLLENHLSQPILQKMLPKLTNLLHDTSERVRLAFLDLLLQVKSIKLIKFFDIVKVEHLIARLAEDSPVVCEKISQLLLNTFFPYKRPGSTQIQRALFLLHENATAGQRFFECATNLVPPSACVKLIGYLTRRLHRAWQRQQSSNDAADTNDAKETADEAAGNNEETSPQQEQQSAVAEDGEEPVAANDPLSSSAKTKIAVSMNDHAFVDSVLIVVSLLWDSLAVGEKLSDEHEVFLRKALDDDLLVDLLKDRKRSVQARCALFRIASHLKHKQIPEFSARVLPALRSFVGANDASLAPPLQCLAQWNKQHHIHLLLQHGWAALLGKPELASNGVSAAKRAKTAQTAASTAAKEKETAAAAGKRSFAILSAILANADLKPVFVAWRESLVEWAGRFCNRIDERLQEIAKPTPSDDEDPRDDALAYGFGVMCRAALHLAALPLAERLRNASAAKRQKVVESNAALLTALTKLAHSKCLSRSSTLAHHLIESAAAMCTEAVTLGVLREAPHAHSNALSFLRDCAKLSPSTLSSASLLQHISKAVYHLYAQNSHSGDELLFSLVQSHSVANEPLDGNIRMPDILSLLSSKKVGVEQFTKALVKFLADETEADVTPASAVFIESIWSKEDIAESFITALLDYITQSNDVDQADESMAVKLARHALETAPESSRKLSKRLEQQLQHNQSQLIETN